MEKASNKKYSKGLVFGVFDIFHKGHEYFIDEALKRCDELVVVVTLSEIVQILKNRMPKNSFDVRFSRIKKYKSNLTVVPGDAVLGSWKVLKDNQFDIIFLGYDQDGIAKELDKMKVPYEFIDSHHPDVYKSSLYKTDPRLL